MQYKEEQNAISETQKTLVYEFSKSCIVKFFLSESEKFIMIYMALLETSAEYSLVAGLVGLICRFVFQPIEETSFIMFA